MEAEQRVHFVELEAADWPQVYSLWAGTPGLVLRDDDTEEGFAGLVRHYPGLCLGARADSRLIAVLLAGYDGKRGYLYHMTVAEPWRRRGIGAALADRVLLALRAAGAARIHLLVAPDNGEGIAFWQRLGFRQRDDVALMTLAVN